MGLISDASLAQWASLGLGAVVGLIAVSIFAVILIGLDQNNTRQTVKALKRLATWSAGGAISDTIFFDYILEQHAIVFYMTGYVLMFLVAGSPVFFSWVKRRFSS
jgi:hypothetical protein